MADDDLSTEGGRFEKLPGGESGVDAYRFVPDSAPSESGEPKAQPEPQPQSQPEPQLEAASGGVAGLHPKFIEGIKQSEGFAARASWDYKQYTNGYGTRARYPGEPIDQETADQRFSSEITKAAQVVDAVNPKLDSGTRAAMTSLTFNAGESWVHSALGERIRAGDVEGARNIFQQYNRAGGAVNPGLVARRGREAAWFGQDETAGERVLGAGGFMPEGAQLSRQGLAQMPVTFPGRMAVKSDTSNFPPSSNIDDRRQPGPIQRSKDAINDAYLATRAMLGMGPMPPRYANVKNPDDRLGSVKDIRDRVDVIRERHQKENELFDQAHVDYKADSDAYFAEREANEAAVSKYHTDLDSYLTDLMKAATKGQQAKFVKQRGPVPPPPADMTRKHPDPEQYFGETARYKIYNKLNPE